MKISSRFSIAVHILSILKNNPSSLCTSDYMAESVNTNPVVIRKIMSYLKQAGFVYVNRGPGGAGLLKDLHEITLLDVYHAVNVVEEDKLFHIHEQPNPDCPIKYSSGIRSYINTSAICDGRSFEKYYDGAAV